jgi:hypothetical protein
MTIHEITLNMRSLAKELASRILQSLISAVSLQAVIVLSSLAPKFVKKSRQTGLKPVMSLHKVFQTVGSGIEQPDQNEADVFCFLSSLPLLPPATTAMFGSYLSSLYS